MIFFIFVDNGWDGGRGNLYGGCSFTSPRFLYMRYDGAFKKTNKHAVSYIHTCQKKNTRQICPCAENKQTCPISLKSSGQHDLALKQPLSGPIYRDGLDAGAARTHPDVGEHLLTLLSLSDAHFAAHIRLADV